MRIEDIKGDWSRQVAQYIISEKRYLFKDRNVSDENLTSKEVESIVKQYRDDKPYLVLHLHPNKRNQKDLLEEIL